MEIVVAEDTTTNNPLILARGIVLRVTIIVRMANHRPMDTLLHHLTVIHLCISSRRMDSIDLTTMKTTLQLLTGFSITMADNQELGEEENSFALLKMESLGTVEVAAVSQAALILASQSCSTW